MIGFPVAVAMYHMIRMTGLAVCGQPWLFTIVLTLFFVPLLQQHRLYFLKSLHALTTLLQRYTKKHIADYYSYPIYTLKPLGLLGVHFKLDGKHESDHE